MRVAEILRGLADILANIEDDKPAQAVAPVVLNINGQTASTPEPSPEQAGDTSAEPGDDTMVPPLQQKLEIMKKMAGLPNQATNAAVQASDDEPFESLGE